MAKKDKAAKKAAKKARKAAEKLAAKENTTTEEMKPQPDENILPSELEIPSWSGNNLDFQKLKRELPAVPHGSDPAFQDHFFNTPIGQLRVRINQDTANGKAGRRNTQLDGKQVIASVLKTMLDGSQIPSTDEDVERDDRVEGIDHHPHQELYDATYKRKDLKVQLDLMGIKIKKSQLKSLNKKLSGLEITNLMTTALKQSPKTVTLTLEALSR